jgi:hypothetical protein
MLDFTKIKSDYQVSRLFHQETRPDDNDIETLDRLLVVIGTEGAAAFVKTVLTVLVCIDLPGRDQYCPELNAF